MPAPSFNAPSVARAYVAPVRPVSPVKPVAPVRAKPPVVAMAGIPKSWVPQVPVRPWRYVVVHHSDTPTGSAAKFDAAHRAKGWDELGYDFVIGNGTETGDGQIEVGPRWTKQKWGAHAKTPDNRYNDYGIGICLVGNFDVTHPTAAQMRSLAKLTSYLIQTYHIPLNEVIGHRDTKATDCPGKYMDLNVVRRMTRDLLVARGYTPTEKTYAAGQELLRSNRK
jgi:hypothetical protein